MREFIMMVNKLLDPESDGRRPHDQLTFFLPTIREIGFLEVVTLLGDFFTCKFETTILRKSEQVGATIHVLQP